MCFLSFNEIENKAIKTLSLCYLSFRSEINNCLYFVYAYFSCEYAINCVISNIISVISIKKILQKENFVLTSKKNSSYIY